MIQLIINDTEYPETSHDRYKCYEEDIGESLRMISGRLVTEVSATIKVIEYNYDYFEDALMQQCLADLRSNSDLNVQFLDPASSILIEGMFKCTKKPMPTFAFSVGGEPRWHNISFKLESVEGV